MYDKKVYLGANSIIDFQRITQVFHQSPKLNKKMCQVESLPKMIAVSMLRIGMNSFHSPDITLS